MEPKRARIEPFTVRGIGVRTMNRDEMNPSTAKLPGVWQEFYASGVADRVPGRVAGSPVYGVYSEYESDANGRYTLTAGVAVSPAQAQVVSGSVLGASEPGKHAWNTVSIAGGDYLVFEARGTMPLIVIETWRAVWQYFAEKRKLARAYTTDFELYRGQDEVAIHIAVARS